MLMILDVVLPRQVVDWSSVGYVSGVNLKSSVVAQKFLAWDKVSKQGLDFSALQLLKDPTVYEYAFYRDEDGNPFTYAAYQDLILSTANEYDFTPDHPSRYILFRASNQIGKSRALRGYTRYLVATKENINIVLISNNLKNSQFLLAEIRKEFNNSAFGDTWREDVGETANTTMLTFERDVVDKVTGKSRKILNRIICAPAGEGALGYPVDYLFLDELDFYEDAKTLFWRVFFPRTKKTKGQIIGFSNPNPDIPVSESLLKELWDGDLFQRKFHFNFLDAPWNTEEEFERDRRNSPSHIFASTHLGQWPEDGGAFLTTKEINDMLDKSLDGSSLPPVDRPVYVGIDLGKMRDNTVISVGIVKEPKFADDKYSDLEVLYQEELPLGTKYNEIMLRYKEINDFYQDNYFGVDTMGYDATGQKSFEDFLKLYGVSGVPVDFSKKETNKTLLYNDFKLLAENRKIKIVHSVKCEKQLANLQFKYTENKKLKKVENKSDSIHDDFADSIVILINVAVRKNHRAPSVTIIGKEAKNKQDSEFADIWNLMGL